MLSIDAIFFRIAPCPEKIKRTCHSANAADLEDIPSSPDPLEPWSTKGIANMNKILAWDNEPDSI